MNTKTSTCHSFRHQFTRTLGAMALPAALLLAVGAGCSSDQAMRPSANVPASEGTVDATLGDNGNTKLSVTVHHLATPERVASGATVYVVWVEPANAAKQSVGILTVSDELDGKLETVTSFEKFRLTVTPEANGQISQPTNAAVFTADVQRKE